jgi:hypothetical protein
MPDYENIELKRFYQSCIQDIRNEQLSREEGGSLEELFTEWSVDMLAEAGETENSRVAFDEKALGTKNQHKINGYSISDNYETIDLFITIFKGTDEPSKIGKDEIDTAGKRILNFFRKGIYKEYVNEIEESSPIFDFAHTLSNSADLKANLVRVNAMIITDGLYNGSVPEVVEIYGYPFNYRVIDIEYLYNISEKSHIPIEIDFKSEGFTIPCIESTSINDEYQSYLAIMPGTALATIYERFGSRLLEQNVRSFLQFTGKINKGIRSTILNEPHMFLAFNNGIAATAEEVEIERREGGSIISKIKDFQIVNGGQTTASVYHTYKKDKADISRINVQIKLSLVKNHEKFSEIVSRISEYANTQNKVSISDLSSNRPFHIVLEKLSRTIVTPHTPGKTNQTRWFYERARGQYKNARIKEGFTKSKLKAFDLMHPKNQLFTKEELAKFQNCYHEVFDGRKLVIGPHMVARGNQKNYAQFINYNDIQNPDNIYFEDLIAKAIIVRSAEKIYGVKPNSIGDMRFITVPYSISYLGYKTDYRIDLYKIWKNQAISAQLFKFLYDLMVQVEAFIKANAPGSLYGEWAKKEECWTAIKQQTFDLDYSIIEEDFINPANRNQRVRISDDEALQKIIHEESERIRSVPYQYWHKIEEWGKQANELTDRQRNVAFTLAGRIRNNSKISEYERKSGLKILDIVIEKVPELLFESDELPEQDIHGEGSFEVTLEDIKKLVEWDKKNKRLKDQYFRYMFNVASGKTPFDEKAKKMADLNFKAMKRFGFNQENSSGLAPG